MTGSRTVMAYVEWDECVRAYVGSVPGVSGAHSQGATLDELRDNLRDVLGGLEETGLLDHEEIPCFVGLMSIDVALPEIAQGSEGMCEDWCGTCNPAYPRCGIKCDLCEQKAWTIRIRPVDESPIGHFEDHLCEDHTPQWMKDQHTEFWAGRRIPSHAARIDGAALSLGE